MWGLKCCGACVCMPQCLAVLWLACGGTVAEGCACCWCACWRRLLALQVLQTTSR